MAAQNSRQTTQSYKDLEIYKKSQDLAIRVHRMTLDNLPRFEMHEKVARLDVRQKGLL